jgi:hypothetical protein
LIQAVLGVASRWLVEGSRFKDQLVAFCLAIQKQRVNGQDVYLTHTIAHQVLRMIESIHENEKIDRGTLYTEFGKSYFIDKNSMTYFLGLCINTTRS